MYTQWGNAMVNPSTYGALGGFINPATYNNLANPFAGFIPAPAYGK
jgi:hypothetical protein